MSEETTQVSLSLNDLKVCLQIIDLCSQRGAFKPEEFQAVGIIHQKLSAFLSQAQAAQASSATEKDAPEETEEETKND